MLLVSAQKASPSTIQLSRWRLSLRLKSLPACGEKRKIQTSLSSFLLVILLDIQLMQVRSLMTRCHGWLSNRCTDFLNGWLDGELLNALHTCDLGGMDEGAFDPAYCLTVDKTPCFKTPSVNELIMQGPGQSSPPLDGLPGVEGTSDAEFCPTVKTMTSAGGNIWSSCAGGSASEPPKAQPSKVKDDENADTPDDTLPLKPDPADQVSSQFDVMPTSSRYPAKTSPSAIPQVTETGRGGWRGRYGDNQEQDYGQYNDGAGNNAQYHKAVVEESEASAKESEYTGEPTSL